MGARAAAAIARAALVCALAAACTPAPAPRALALGDSLPRAWLGGVETGGAMPLVWVFRTEDCLSCQALDHPLRRVQAAYGAAVPLVAVHVGARADSLLVRSYFARRRLRVSHALTLPGRRFRGEVGDIPLPALFLVKGGRIAWSSTAVEPGAGPLRLDSLVAALGGARAGEAAPGPAPGVEVQEEDPPLIPGGHP